MNRYDERKGWKMRVEGRIFRKKNKVYLYNYYKVIEKKVNERNDTCIL